MNGSGFVNVVISSSKGATLWIDSEVKTCQEAFKNWMDKVVLFLDFVCPILNFL